MLCSVYPLLILRADWGGGGEAPGIHIPNLLTNYPTKLHEIKTMCTNITPEHMSNCHVCAPILLPNISV